MPRRPRPEIVGGFFHIYTRGIGKAPLYLDEFDYAAWLGMLARTVEEFHWRCHAYCALRNHFHLLIETREPTRAAGMRHLNGSYAQRFNERYDASGHVFQGRYGATTILTDPHLLECSRYIALNPVRAGASAEPRTWRWSSYRATAGVVPPPSFLTLDLLHSMCAGAAGYRRFVAEGHVEGPGPEAVSRTTHASRA